MDRSPRTDVPVDVRPAHRTDLPRVAEIFAPYVTGTVVTFEEDVPTVADWGRRLADLADRGLPFLVACVAGDVVGYAYAGPWRPKPAYRHTVEDTVYLAPGQGGRGIGSRLLAALVDASAAAGARRMVAVVADAPEAAASLPLHRRLGFEQVGVLPAVGYKHGRWVDTVLLQRALGD